MATKDARRTTTVTLDTILGEVKGVGRKVDGLSKRVDVLDQRVTSLESTPNLKTRIVHQARNGGDRVIQPEVSDEELEEEAIMAGGWEKVIKKARCYRIDVTKVRSPQFADCWKLIFRLRGERRPATLIGFDGLNELIEMVRDVWPQVNEDIFDEALFEEKWAERRKTDPNAPLPVIYSDDKVLFEVEHFKTPPNYRGHTYINVERLYPIDD